MEKKTTDQRTKFPSKVKNQSELEELQEEFDGYLAEYRNKPSRFLALQLFAIANWHPDIQAPSEFTVQNDDLRTILHNEHHRRLKNQIKQLEKALKNFERKLKGLKYENRELKGKRKEKLLESHF